MFCFHLIFPAPCQTDELTLRIIASLYGIYSIRKGGMGLVGRMKTKWHWLIFLILNLLIIKSDSSQKILGTGGGGPQWHTLRVSSLPKKSLPLHPLGVRAFENCCSSVSLYTFR